MKKRTPLPCTPANCGEAFPKCGRYTTYGNHKCRCEPCSAAYSEYKKQHYRKNREAKIVYQRQYYAEHREAALDYQKQQYAENREAKIAYQARRYAENREAVAQWAKRYRELNREKIAEDKKRYAGENSAARVDYVRQWRLANPERARDNGRRSGHRRRARMKQVQVIDFTPEQFEQKMAYYGHSCYLKLDCCTGAFDHVEHVKPIDKLGPHMLANLRPSCEPCNSRKWAHWPFTLAG